MKKIIPIFLSALLCGGCAGKTPTQNTYRQISIAEAIIMMETEQDYIILDVRTSEEFEEKHIPNGSRSPTLR